MPTFGEIFKDLGSGHFRPTRYDDVEIYIGAGNTISQGTTDGHPDPKLKVVGGGASAREDCDDGGGFSYGVGTG